MPLAWKEIRDRAIAFSREYANECNEDAEAKTFLDAFFNVFGISRRRFIKFEDKVRLQGGKDGFIDSIWKGVILVEMKSSGRNLDRAYDQARGYFYGLKEDELPRYVLVSDFQRFRLYDLDEDRQWEFPLKDLANRVRLFGFLAGYQQTEIKEQDPVNIKAAEEMGKIHDELQALGYEGHELRLYLVRLLFCLYADDTSLFNTNLFYDYIAKSKEDGSDLALRIARLFDVLNTQENVRLKSLQEELTSFPFVNGRLFEERLGIADFTSKMRTQLLHCGRLDWRQVSPAIFGSMFQSVMKAEERRSLGAHYTSEENILKVIRPLFLDDLYTEFAACKTNRKKLEAFHNKLAGLRFLDPACGCGNFLIISYRELRLLELEVMKALHGGEQFIEVASMARVNVDQFYGIELEEFPAQIAQVAMWLIDHQMNMRLSDEFGKYYVRLPLRSKANIVIGNALRLDWYEIVSPASLSFILGNPPFQGARTMNEEQKADMIATFNGTQSVGNLDYVTAWYRKAAEYIQGTSIEVAFVSTNSICQGEQVSLLWDDLMERFDISINFAYRTFKWSNEARGKAAVHCIIVGFACVESNKKVIYDGAASVVAKNINPYLVDAPNLTVKSRSTPLCDVPQIRIGNKPIDGGNYLFSEIEYQAFVLKEPSSNQWFRKWYGADEYINGWNRYCLYLRDCPPEALRALPECAKRVEAVRNYRLASPSAQTRKLAATPTRFHVESPTGESCIVIPQVSSESRKYIPIGYIGSDVLCGDKLRIMPGATLYHFGILTSSMHMAWMRLVTGRMKSDYSYSIDIVYNNFPWPDSSLKMKEQIEELARAVLAARALYPSASLADLYDPVSMPVELTKAHLELDSAVERAYGKRFLSDADRVSFLMERYYELTKEGIK